MLKRNKFSDLLYFSKKEFASPDLPNSGLLMKKDFLEKLDSARHLAEIPFIINSGYRTPEHNKKVGGVKTSSHLKGLAVDIKTVNIIERYKIVNALLMVGFTRIGIAANFIHVDLDFSKGQNVIWLY